MSRTTLSAVARPLHHLAGATLIAVLTVQAPAAAQLDWVVQGDAEGLLLTQDEDDGLDGDAEINMTVEWMHYDAERDVTARAVTSKAVSQNNDVEGLNLQGLGLAQAFSTEECDEADWIFAAVQMTEQDMSATAEDAISKIAGVVVGVTVSINTGNPYAGATSGLVAAVATKALLQWMGSGTDDLGSIPMTQLDFGINDFQLTGGDGGAHVRLTDSSYQSGSVQLECHSSRGQGGPNSPLDPDAAVAGIFPDLLSALDDVATMALEDGTVDAEVYAARASMTAALMSLAEFAAVTALAEAQFGFDGAAAALPLLADARAHRAAGQWHEAAVDYRESFRIAYSAIWDGNFAPTFSLPSHMTVIAPVRSVRAESYHEFQGVVQGLSATETIDFVDVDGQDSGMEFDTWHGVERTGVVLAGDLLPDHNARQVLGLGRISGAVVRGPDATCDGDHLEEGFIGGGVFIDEQGPFFEPDPDGCGYGQIVTLTAGIDRGGVPFGSTADSNGIFTAELDLTSELQPGSYDLTFTAHITDSSDGSSRQVSAPITLLVPAPGELFSDGFENGSTAAWSANAP